MLDPVILITTHVRYVVFRPRLIGNPVIHDFGQNVSSPFSFNSEMFFHHGHVVHFSVTLPVLKRSTSAFVDFSSVEQPVEGSYAR
jgi:hypothetical protein